METSLRSGRRTAAATSRELDTQSMPNLAAHTASKTCFDAIEVLFGRAQMSVPACPERSYCVAVSTMWPTERLRVQTRRPARVRHKRLHPYAATFPWRRASPGSRADQCWRMVIHRKAWHSLSCQHRLKLVNSFVTVSRWIYASGAAAYIPSCFARQRRSYKSARTASACR